MYSRARVSTHRQSSLETFELVSAEPGRHAGPADVPWSGALAARAPSTVAAALAAAKKLDLESPPDLDRYDHWYRTRLPDTVPDGELALVFEGLATLTDVWVAGEHVLRSENMFARHEVNVTGKAQPGAELVLCFRALAPHLSLRRPRPRWRTRLVDQQQLRWVRTSLIGRTPGFCPNVPPVGPYRPVRLEGRAGHRARQIELQPSLEGEGGRVRVSMVLEAIGSVAPASSATLVVDGAAGSGSLRLHGETAGKVSHFTGALVLPRVAAWWPHTHGDQPLSSARLVLDDGTELDLGRIGFREILVDRGTDGKGFGLVVNGSSIFCRGACWTTDDVLTLGVASVRRTLALVRAAGMNMLRVGGTTAYETDAFYDLCDELGILVFQDFMFANMDYPIGDPGFRAQVEAEARTVLGRLAARPSLAVLCGGSEVEQQVAMLGMPREAWQSSLFYELLPEICRELSPTTPYVPSTPTGGDLPFQTDEGITHYYGVGAYLRPLEDARRSRVRFAAECLAFANVPSSRTIERFLGDLEMPGHHPRWKERVPRDRGVGWDFEDVRDHYVRALFDVDPARVRYSDPERYLALGRAASGEVMESAFSEWRSTGSTCRGALVFFLKDFWDGAGWGVIDASGVPKSAYHYLARVSKPVTLVCTDEGLNGVHFHAINETGASIEAHIHLTLYRAGEIVVASAERTLRLDPRSTTLVRAEGLLERFADTAYAYKFGPPGHDLVVGKLLVGDDILARAFHTPLGRAFAQELDLGLAARIESRHGRMGLLVSTRRFARCVSIEVPGYLPEDDYFHLEPRGERFIVLDATDGAPAPRGVVRALNATSAVPVRPSSPPDTGE